MRFPLPIRRLLQWAISLLAAGVVALVGFAAAVDAGYFHDLLIRLASSHSQRPITVSGALKTHLLSLHPRFTAERVAIGNPSWLLPGPAAEIGALTLAIELPWFGHSFGIEELQLESAALHLVRDAAGRANWQAADPASGQERGLPIIRRLAMPGAHVQLDDTRRHLQFDGTISARDAEGAAGARPLRIEGAGQLNGHAVNFEIDGDPLVEASHAKPYHFTFSERSSGSHLAGNGALARPFDLTVLDLTFNAEGADLRDLYFLTGLRLMNTGNYRLSGRLARRGTRSMFDDLLTTFGDSDLRGTVAVESETGRPVFTVDLKSQFLRLADLGVRAAGRESEADAAAPLMFSRAKISPQGVRKGDAVVNFHARRLQVGHVMLTSVSIKVGIDGGVVVVAPLLADVLDGKVVVNARVDARTDDPTADVDFKFDGLQLGKLDQNNPGEPPVDGLLHARIIVKGHGTSAHAIAATANGTVSAVLPHGTLRASLAELTGIDLRGVGLLLTKNHKDTGVRCAVASFKAHDGTLSAQGLIVDTDRVLITGGGEIRMDSEALDLNFRGHPKELRLARLRWPLSLHGTLLHPKVRIQVGHSVGQTAEAIALGVLLTPLAAVLALVDPGLAKDADCAALLATARSLDSRSPVAAATH